MNTQLVRIVHMINKVNNVGRGSEGKACDVDSEMHSACLSATDAALLGFVFKHM